MKKLFFAIFLLSLLSALSVNGQESFRCGTVGELAAPITERLLRNREAAETQAVEWRSTQYVPIKFHLVARTDGSGRVLESSVLEELCFLNKVFADQDIQFYIKDGFNYVNNTAVYTDPPAASPGIMSILRVRDAMNVWIVGAVQPNEPTVLGYYTPVTGRDWIVINRSTIGGGSKALAHEIGHFFSLQHTHFGWDSKPWDLTVGNPAPVIAPDGIPTERASGSNCKTAGDYLCDTPADYNGFGWSTCSYNKGARDPDSVLIDPDENNFMSYFFGCPLNEQNFTQEQKNAMRADLASPSRNYIRRAFTPVAINQPPQLVAPVADVQVAAASGPVRLEWAPVAGATSYIVEVDRVASFTIQPIRVVVPGASTATDISGLAVGRRYFWRVRPFNSYASCATLTSEVQSFQLVDQVSAVNTISFVRSWSLSPNPVGQGRELFLALDSDQSFEAEVVLFSITGQALRSLGSSRFATGANRLAIPTAGLAPGVYLLSLNTEKGRLNQRVVVF